jgi:ABC-type amino acid transport substrate-binding protein
MALLIIVAELAYVRRDLPPMAHGVEAEQKPRIAVETAPETHTPQQRPAGSDAAPTASLHPTSQMPGQAPSHIAKIQQWGRLMAAVQENFNPFSFLDTDQQRVGFDIDLMREFARRWLGDADAVTFVPVTTDRRIATLLEGNVDLIAAALTHTPARQQQIAFSHTYFQDGQRLLVPEDAEVNEVCDLQGKPIAVTRGSTAVDHVQAQASACGFTAELFEVETHAEAVAAVLAGKAGAFSTDGLALEQFAAGKPLKVVGNHFSEEPYGLGLPKGDETFRRLVNLTLATMYADGTLTALYQKWFQESLRPYPIPPFNKDTAAPELLALATTDVPPLFPTRQGAPSPAKQYVVQRGDTLSRIAGKVYGDVSPRSWKRIYEANQAVIGANPSRLRIGMQLTIPES